MPPQPSPQPEAPHTYTMPSSMWFVAAFVVVLLVGIFLGVQLAHSNSDYVCSKAVNDTQQGACTNGSWGDWQTVNGTLQRTYTGTQTTVTFTGVLNNLSCSHPTVDKTKATGTTTVAYAICQIVQTGTGPGGGGTPGTGSDVTITSSKSQVVSTLSSTESTGTYGAFQNTVDTALATSSIRAVPSLVSPSATTTLYWSSDHVDSCVVTGDPSGASWNTLASPDAGQVSSPITQQTIYTLTCITPAKTSITSQAIVNLLPSYQEK